MVLLDAGSDRLRARPRLGSARTELFATSASAKTAAPEQIRGLVADSASDVYSFGAMAFELLTGRAPFAGESALDAAFGHLTQAPVTPSSVAPRGFVPPEVDELILNLLEKEPNRRPANAREVLARLQRSDRPSASPPDAGEEVKIL